MRAILKGGFWNHLAPPKVGANNRISWNISTGVLIEWEKMRIRKNMGVFGKTRFLKNPWFRWKRRFPENAFFSGFLYVKSCSGKCGRFPENAFFFSNTPIFSVMRLTHLGVPRMPVRVTPQHLMSGRPAGRHALSNMLNFAFFAVKINIFGIFVILSLLRSQ